MTPSSTQATSAHPTSPHATSTHAAIPQTMVFVDAGYLFHVMATHHQVRNLDDLAVSYEALVDLIRRHIESQLGPILRIRWYDATDPTHRTTNHRAQGISQVAGVQPGRRRVVTQP